MVLAQADPGALATNSTPTVRADRVRWRRICRWARRRHGRPRGKSARVTVQANGPRTTGTSSTTPTSKNDRGTDGHARGQPTDDATASTMPLDQTRCPGRQRNLWEACSMSSRTTRLIPSRGVTGTARRAGTATPMQRDAQAEKRRQDQRRAVICSGGSD